MSDDAHTKDGSSSSESHTYAAFSPASSSSYAASRSTVVIHQKSPLLLATPPQVTRALAHSLPFLLPLNKLLGLVSWTTDDPWESYLLVAAFWAITIYGGNILRWGGPLILAIGLILGMYGRRFSPLSTSFGTTPAKAPSHTRNLSSVDAKDPTHSRSSSEVTTARHHDSLDSIVANLTTLTHRCNILLTPFLQLTDFLSTQRTATSSTTSPALFALFTRLLALTPIWFALTLRPIHIITTKRIVLTLGTLILTWHSRPAVVSRVILWRSRTVRRTCAWTTGLDFSATAAPSPSPPKPQSENTAPHRLARKASQRALAQRTSHTHTPSRSRTGRSKGPGIGTGEGIRFTFSLFENERRWLGIGWTSSMLAYERSAWTDEELNAAPPKEEFRLPSVDSEVALWRWVPGSSWKIETSDTGDLISGGRNPDMDMVEEKQESAKSDEQASAKSREAGWLYTDTKWRYPRRGQDGWGKYTRRRKWVREAELVDAEPSDLRDEDDDRDALPSLESIDSPAPALPPRPSPYGRSKSSSKISVINGSVTSTPSKPGPDHQSGTSTPAGSPAKRGWFARKRTESKASEMSFTDDGKDKASSVMSVGDRDSDREDDGYIPLHLRGRQGAVGADWGVGEDVGGYLE